MPAGNLCQRRGINAQRLRQPRVRQNERCRQAWVRYFWFGTRLELADVMQQRGNGDGVLIQVFTSVSLRRMI